MKRIFLAAAVLIWGFASRAQDADKSSPDNKLKNYDEIIIKKKDDSKNGKVTVEIKDKEIIVDGKPLDDYDSDEFTVTKSHPKSYNLNYPESPFRLDGNSWSTEGDFDNPGGERAFLGVLSQKSPDGAKISEITEGSAADKAGLKKGDVVTKVDDQAIADHEQLSAAIAAKQPQDKITVTYTRDGKENQTTATLGGRKITHTRTFRSQGPMGQYNAPDLNLPPMNFNFDDNGLQHMIHGKPRLGIRAQDTEEGKGVKVIDVDENSPAAKAGIRNDDIITSFDGREVNSADELANASRESSDKSTLKVQLKRNGKSQNLEIKIPKKLKTATL